MPMYFPDLESVKRIAKMMTEHKGEKRYKGIIPQTEKELSEARKQLGQYFRIVWKDIIQAMEIELAVTKENYHKKLGQAIQKRFLP